MVARGGDLDPSSPANRPVAYLAERTLGNDSSGASEEESKLGSNDLAVCQYLLHIPDSKDLNHALSSCFSREHWKGIPHLPHGGLGSGAASYFCQLLARLLQFLTYYRLIYEQVKMPGVCLEAPSLIVGLHNPRGRRERQAMFFC